MDNKIELTVKVNSDTGQLEIVNQKLGKTAEAANKTSSSFSGLSKEAGGLVKSFLPFASAGAVVAFFASAVKGAEEQNESFRRLKFTLESTGQSWEKNKASISEWADAVASATRFSDGEALNSLDELARATKNLTQAKGASTLAQDLSTVSGKTLSETTRLVSDLITGQERAVTQANKEFMNYAGGAKTAQEALDNLSRSTKNAAVNEESFTKSLAQSTNAFGQFKDQIGNTVMPAVQTITGGLVFLLKVLDNMGQVIAGELAVAFHAFTGIGDAITEMLKGNFTSAKNIAKQTIENIRNDFTESGNKIVEEWANNEKKKTEILKEAHQDRLAVNAAQEDDEKKTPLGPSKEDFEKYQNERAASNERLLTMEDELNVRMAQLDDNSLQGKLNVLKAEETAELNKVAKEKGYEENKEKVVAQIRGVYRKKEEAALKVDAKMKAQMAMQAADVAIQALQTIDSMGEVHSKSDARRAKLFLALRQSMAIANAWVSALDKDTPGPIWAKVAMAAATTGLIVAQFASQSKAIDKARATNESEASSTSISTDYGNGTTITDTFGGSSSGSTTSGGVSSLGSSGGGSSGGGGGSTIINVGGVTVQFTADNVDLSSVEVVARRLGEEVLRRTTEGVHLAVAIRNVGEANKNLAV